MAENTFQKVDAELSDMPGQRAVELYKLHCIVKNCYNKLYNNCYNKKMMKQRNSFTNSFKSSNTIVLSTSKGISHGC